MRSFFMQGSGSAANEPFANKSARFAMIDRTNNVRKGQDTLLLNSLCDGLEAVRDDDAEMRRRAFCYAMSLVLRRPLRGAPARTERTRRHRRKKGGAREGKPELIVRKVRNDV